MSKSRLIKWGVGISTALSVSLIPVSAHALTNTADIADGAVTTAKLAGTSVSNGKLQGGSVTTTKIRARAVTTSKLAGGSVTNSKLATGAVGTSKIAAGAVTGAKLASDIAVASAITRTTGATGSFQNLAGDLTYEGAAGGTSTYHAGVMGNFLGSALTNTTSSYHAGVIGSYNVETSDASTGAEAGVVGEIGTDLGTASAVVAVLGGDSGTLTPNAAYGVQYFNSTAASKFDYGLDLFHAATADYTGVSAVDYGTADIRLASGATIASGTTNPTAACVLGSLFLNTTDAKLYVCTVVTPTWTVVGTQT